MDAPRIVIGLGNPGTRYGSTRHNIGFGVVDLLARRRGGRFRLPLTLGRRVWIAKLGSGDGDRVLAKPRTYMNRSGRAALALCRRFGVSARDLLVVYDDADLPLGRLRIRSEGSAGGHNGMQSIIDTLQTSDFPRLRLGVRGSGRSDRDLADYLLAPFDPEELPVARQLVELGADAAEAVLCEGVTAAMNRFNALSASAT